MLLAYEKGAELIVAVGTHFNLVEFLERNRAGHVVDVPDAAASGGAPRRREGRLAARQPPVGVWPLVAVHRGGLAAILVAILVSPTCRR